MHVNVCSRNAFWICSRVTTSVLCPDSSRCFNDCFNSITLCSHPLFVYLQPSFICSHPLFGFPFFICSHPNLLLTSLVLNIIILKQRVTIISFFLGVTFFSDVLGFQTLHESKVSIKTKTKNKTKYLSNEKCLNKLLKCSPIIIFQYHGQKVK